MEGDKIDKNEFIDFWLSNIPKSYCPDRAYFEKKFVVLPCGCEEKICKGWAVIPNEPFAIDHHNRMRNPETWNTPL